MSTNKNKIDELTKQVVGILSDISRTLGEVRDGDDSAEESCEMLVVLNALKAEIAVVYDDAVSVVAGKMDNLPEVTLSDGTKLEKKSASDRKTWDHKGLANVVSERLSQMAVDMNTGEVVMSSKEIAMKMLDYMQPSYWRVKELGKIGVSADDYCQVSEESKTSVIVRRPKQ